MLVCASTHVYTGSKIDQKSFKDQSNVLAAVLAAVFAAVFAAVCAAVVVCLFACLLAFLLAFLLACLLACLLASLGSLRSPRSAFQDVSVDGDA